MRCTDFEHVRLFLKLPLGLPKLETVTFYCSYTGFNQLTTDEQQVFYTPEQGFPKSDTVGLPIDDTLKKAPPPPIQLLAQFCSNPGYLWDPYHVMIMFFDPIDTQQLLFDITSDYTKYIKRYVLGHLLAYDSGKNFHNTNASLS